MPPLTFLGPVNTGDIYEAKDGFKKTGFTDTSFLLAGGGTTLVSNFATYTNIAASYYTKTQLQTSGQAQVNWGNLTGVPATFPATAHNHDDRYYTETESDTRFVLKSFTPLTQEDLILDLSFNEGSGSICHSAVGSNFVTLSNGTSFTTGVSGTGVNMPANGRGTLNTPISNTDLTISVWHRYNNTGGSSSWRAIIGTEANYFPILLRNKRELTHYGPVTVFTGVLIPDDNKYHHIVYTFSSTNQLKIYLDGVLIHSGNHTFDFTNYPITGIGNSNAYGYGSGDNDEVKIYKRVLNDNEIYDLFKSSLFSPEKIHANQVIGLPTSLPPTAHTHTISDVTGLQTILDGKEPVFTKNSAFNKNFGTVAGTVAQGNHTHNYSDLNGLPTIPTVNNGTLTLSTGTGLSGSATFGANQSTAATFTVGIASGYKLPTTTEWNGKFNVPTGTTSQYVRGDGTLATFPTIPQGTVTSVAMTAPTGLSVAGSPITGSGTLALSYATGYQGYTTAESTKLAGIAANADNYGSWNLKTNGVQRIAVTSGGTLDLVAGTNVSLSYAAGGVVTISSTNTVYTHPTTPGNKHIPAGGAAGQILRWSADGTAVWGADNNTTYSAGTGLTLTTTTFSVNYGTTAGTAAQGNDSRIINGQTAYGWGNHASQGYLTGFTETDPTVPTWVKSITMANIAEWQGKVNRHGDVMSGGLSVNPGTLQHTHELKTDNAGGRNDIYIRSDNANTQFRASVQDSGIYTFGMGPISGGGVGMGNGPGHDYFQMPASNSKFRMGFFADQLLTYMFAISGPAYFGGEIYTQTECIADGGFVHNQYTDPDALLTSDGGVVHTGIDIVNNGGELRIQPFEITSSGNAINCAIFKHKLVYIRVRGGNKIILSNPQQGQRFILFNVDGSSPSDVEINSSYAGTLDPYTKISLYITNLGENLFYDKGEIYNGGF